MSTEEYKPPLPHDIVTKYISEEELELLQKLEGKLRQAEQALSEEAQKFCQFQQACATDTTNQEEVLGPRPYMVNIQIVCDVLQEQPDMTGSNMVERIHKTYMADFITDNYKIVIDTLYNKIESLLTETCKNTIKNDE
jgi:hypothetical protein